MTYIVLLLCSSLIALGLASTILSAAVLAVLPVVLRRRGLAPCWLLFLRLVPATVSCGVVAAIFVPAFVAHEPWGASERVGAHVWVLAIVCLAGIAVGPVRGFAAWRATATLARRWRRGAEPVALAGWPGRAYRIDSPFPVVTVLGFARSTLFLARRVEESCTAGEIEAMVAHELAHTRNRDNLRRLLFRALPDAVSLLSASATMERAWSEATEVATDRSAIDAGTRRTDLAGALVKVARLAAGTRLIDGEAGPREVLVSAVYDGGGLARRIWALTTDHRPARGGRLLWLTYFAMVTVVVLLGQDAALAGRLHQITEWVVTR